ncbi:MAG TPA: vWA domain-containing protein [Noviherbaspirillum sp.]|jgi:Flp pilus assembly protein TadG|uniref:vWA domain-containing protein n=1 Tax=Noviherbaspirillum sp. TaxID=1926288 RepID=UPI002F922909
MTCTTRGRQAGNVFIVFAISLVMLVGAVGLAVDSGIGYLVRARLNAAADAAAVAGARAATRGMNQAEQRSEAVTAATRFFLANYPPGYLGSTRTLDGVTVRFDDPVPGRLAVDVDARAVVPVTFMQAMGFEKLDVVASAQAIRKDVDMAFVVDTSGSMSGVANEVRRHAAGFLDRFSPTSDRVSLAHFATGAEVDVPIRTGRMRGFDRAALRAAIAGYRFSGFTNSAEGFWHGRDQLNRIAPGDRSSLRVIVFFSDGSPNTVSSHFRLAGATACGRAGSLTTDDGGAVGRPGGLWDPARQDTVLPGSCFQGSGIAGSLAEDGIPPWYNAHGIDDREFPLVTSLPRPVTSDTSTPQAAYVNINRAAKNLPEAMAARARAEGIRVFTLGLGSLLRNTTGPDAAPDDTGENLLKCMANTDDAPARCRAAGAAQPRGTYCHAATADDLQPCFSMLASEILRLSR